MKTEFITLQEAYNRGYTKFGYESKEWQHLDDLYDGIFEDARECGEDIADIRLAEKESRQPSISPEDIADLLSDHIGDCDAEICCRDTEEVYRTVKEIDFTETANMVNEKLSEHKFWMLTNIGLKETQSHE